MSDLKEMIDPTEELSVRSQCIVLGISRSSVYYNTVERNLLPSVIDKD